jgi:SAM-dependent methyltransferase
MQRRLLLAIPLACALRSAPEQPGKAAYQAFVAWRKAAGLTSDWDRAIAAYRSKLLTEGSTQRAVDRVLQHIESYGEAELYDNVYEEKPGFNTEPNKLLTEAVQKCKPGKALDVGMGQGRNSVYLASLGWNVTGFDVSESGLRKARETAASRSLRIHAVHASDEDFEFGEAQWDLIAVIYALEKRSVRRAPRALKPGGLVVAEAGHKSASDAPFEYTSGELPKVFEGFRIVRYEEAVGLPDWGKEPIRLVRLIAEKPR